MTKGLVFPQFNFPTVEIVSKTEIEKVCEKHGPYKAQMITFSDGQKEISGCPFCIEEEHKAEENLIELTNKIEVEKENIEKCRAANIRPEFYNKSLADYLPKTKGQEFAKAAVQKLIETRSGKIVILGSNGVGKTMLSSIAAKALGGKIYKQYEIATMIRQSYSSNSDKTEMEIVKELSNIPFLAIDEVGRIANSEAVQNWFSAILDERHSRRLPFMITGNLHFRKNCSENGCSKCFENYFDNDILSRLRQNATIIVIKAPDERTDKSSVYFSD